MDFINKFFKYKSCCNKYGCHSLECEKVKLKYNTPLVIVGLNKNKNSYIYMREDDFIDKFYDNELNEIQPNEFVKYSKDLIYIINHLLYDYHNTYQSYKNMSQSNKNYNLDYVKMIYPLDYSIGRTRNRFTVEMTKYECTHVNGSKTLLYEYPFLVSRGVYLYFFLIDDKFIYEIPQYDYSRYQVGDKVIGTDYIITKDLTNN